MAHRINIAPGMTDRDALTQDWLQAERIAVAAELELASYGQAAPTPEYREKAMRSAELRRTADELFTRLHSHLRNSEPPAP